MAELSGLSQYKYILDRYLFSCKVDTNYSLSQAASSKHQVDFFLL